MKAGEKSGRKRKSTQDDTSAVQMREEKEDRASILKVEIKGKYGNKYTDPQVVLWARMIVQVIHQSTDESPNFSFITGPTPKCRKPSQSDLTSVATSAATAAVSALVTSLTQRSHSDECPESPHSKPEPKSVPELSPGRMIDMRMKNYEQLYYLQNFLKTMS